MFSGVLLVTLVTLPVLEEDARPVAAVVILTLLTPVVVTASVVTVSGASTTQVRR